MLVTSTGKVLVSLSTNLLTALRISAYLFNFRVNRSIIFTNGTSESRLAAATNEREQAKSKSSKVTTQIQPLETFYPAEPEHQVLCYALSLRSPISLIKSRWW